MYQGFSDQPFDEAFDLILQGMPTVAMLIVNRALTFADAGMELGADEVSGMRKLSGTLSEWAEWTGRGERYPLRGEDEDCLEHLTTGATKHCIEAWRELSVRVITRKISAEGGELHGLVSVEAAQGDVPDALAVG